LCITIEVFSFSLVPFSLQTQATPLQLRAYSSVTYCHCVTVFTEIGETACSSAEEEKSQINEDDNM